MRKSTFFVACAALALATPVAAQTEAGDDAGSGSSAARAPATKGSKLKSAPPAGEATTADANTADWEKPTPSTEKPSVEKSTSDRAKSDKAPPQRKQAADAADSREYNQNKDNQNTAQKSGKSPTETATAIKAATNEEAGQETGRQTGAASDGTGDEAAGVSASADSLTADLAVATVYGIRARPIIEVDGKSVLSDWAYTAKGLSDATVYNFDDDEIGDVADVVMRNGRAESLVIDAGGFLNIGDRRVEAPFDRFVGLVAAGGNELHIAGDAEELKAYPKFSESAAAESDLLASDLLGEEINFDGEPDGEIENPYLDDIVLSPSGEAMFAVVEYGGILGAGEKSALVPFDRVVIAEGDEGVSLAMGPRDIVTATSFYYSIDDARAAGGSASGKASQTDAATRSDAAPEDTASAPDKDPKSPGEGE